MTSWPQEDNSEHERRECCCGRDPVYCTTNATMQLLEDRSDGMMMTLNHPSRSSDPATSYYHLFTCSMKQHMEGEKNFLPTKKWTMGEVNKGSQRSWWQSSMTKMNPLSRRVQGWRLGGKIDHWHYNILFPNKFFETYENRVHLLFALAS